MSQPKELKKQLGVSYGTALYRLMRNIIHNLASETGKDICYRCGEKISRCDFSIEHKEPWLHISPDLFWDLNNITFSHKRCNSKAARQINKRLSKVVPPDGKSWCTEHKQFLSVELFSKNRSVWNGLQRQCNACRRKRNKRDFRI